MKRLIIATALFTAIAFNVAQPFTTSTDVAKGSIPNFPRAGVELPETDVLQQDWAKGLVPSVPRG